MTEVQELRVEVDLMDQAISENNHFELMFLIL